MDSNLLKVFVEVANEKSISKAALNLGFAQSNVTSRIQQLEKSLDICLFHRVPKGVILTTEGEKLYSYAVEIVKKIELANYEMKNINYQKHLIIGSTESNASTRLIPFLLKLNKDFPNMNLELITNTTKETLKNVLNYKVDIAFISGEPTNDSLIVLKKFEEEIAILEPQKDDSPNVALTFKEGCVYDEFLKSYYQQKNIFVEKSLPFGNLETILSCIKVGMGKSLLPMSIVKKWDMTKI